MKATSNAPSGLGEAGSLTRRAGKGFTLIEVLISITILAIGILAVASMQIMAIRGNEFARYQTLSQTWAADWLENLMALDYDDSDLDLTESPPFKFEDSADALPHEMVSMIIWRITDPDFDADGNADFAAKVIQVRVNWTYRGETKQTTVTAIKPDPSV